MTPQEQQLLMQLAQRINQAQLTEKDPDAENLLGRELGANNDALYIMAQTVLVQNIALDQARAQIAQLQQQLQQARQQPAHTTSFLGRLLGEHDQPQAPPQPYQQPQPQAGWQPVAQQPPPPQYQQAPPQPYQPAQYAQPQYVAAPVGQPSFLRGAMQTAAGVAAGALAFEGVESILHGFGHGGGWGPGMGYGMGPGAGFGGGFERPVEETVVNNYYDSPGGGEHRVEHDFSGGQGFGQGTAQDFQAGERHFQNTGDGSGAVYSDANYTTQGGDLAAAGVDQGGYDPGYDPQMDDATAAADNSVDDVQIDDSGGGFDNLGGFDSGGSDNSGGDTF